MATAVVEPIGGRQLDPGVHPTLAMTNNLTLANTALLKLLGKETLLKLNLPNTFPPEKRLQ